VSTLRLPAELVRERGDPNAAVRGLVSASDLWPHVHLAVGRQHLLGFGVIIEHERHRSFHACVSRPSLFCRDGCCHAREWHRLDPLYGGNLEPGPQTVGFRSIFTSDKTRGWRTTRPYGGRFKPDLDGRPIQINLWYPAARRTGVEMRYGDYLTQKTPTSFSILGELARKRSSDAIDDVPKATLGTLLEGVVAAREGASPLKSRHPLILLVGGVGADINANVVLAEYLSSHGYVVASISLLGSSERQPDQSRSYESIEANVRDLEFVTPAICAGVNADCGRLAVVGHSLGGVIATLFANRNDNVSAAISLDGTFGFKGDGRLLTGAFGYAPRRMQAAMLDLRRAEGVQSAMIDLSPVLAFTHADLTMSTRPNVHHSDFTSFAMLADHVGLPAEPEFAGTGWSRATGRQGHENAARIILAFLNTQFMGTPADEVRRRIAAVPGSSLRHVDAAPPMPTPNEAVRIVNNSGLPRLKALIMDACRGAPPSTCVDQALFNDIGYSMMSDDAGSAVALFEIVVWAYPRSANAQDSLADGFAAAGRLEDARRASLRASELAAADPEMDQPHRREIIDAAKRRIEMLDRASAGPN
jgi:pimeloyl-ACP methyl ester carboxylesterase